MTKQERIQSDTRLCQFYTELHYRLKKTIIMLDEISEELDNNIQGECAEKKMANTIKEELLAKMEWTETMYTAWKTLLEKDQEQ